MIRMIMSHPRSRSNLLAAFYEDYTSELFSPVYIRTTDFYQDNKHQSVEWFQRHYPTWLKGKMSGRSFTFKAHHCSVADWPEAQRLIYEWGPGEIIEVYRGNTKNAILSYLLARHRGYVSSDQAEPEEGSIVVTPQEMALACRDITARWEDANNFRYHASLMYNAVPEYALRLAGSEAAYQARIEELGLQEQRSMFNLELFANLNEIQQFIHQFLKP